MPASVEILAMVMAGGKGERLYPLTAERSKPSVPFGGKYRLVDFVLSNLINSDITAVYVLTQYLAQSLIEHIHTGWGLRDIRGRDFVTPVPAQMRTGEAWYRGTADAIFQNMNLLRDHRPRLIAVFGADHVYRMDIRLMVREHYQNHADATVAAIPMPASQSHQFGVIEIDSDGRIVGFEEKPQENPKTIPDRPEFVLASMGNYLFETELLQKVLIEDASRESAHDFGKSILPELYKEFRVFAYDFSNNDFPGRVKNEERTYWRDVGTIKNYFDTSMDLKGVNPVFNLYNQEWPLRTGPNLGAPAKFVFDDDGRRGTAVDSIVGEGTIISGARVDNSILSQNVFVHSFSHVSEAIVMDNVDIGRHSKIHRAIVDKNVKIPPNTEIGFGAPYPNSYVDPFSGITVIPKAGVKL